MNLFRRIWLGGLLVASLLAATGGEAFAASAKLTDVLGYTWTSPTYGTGQFTKSSSLTNDGSGRFSYTVTSPGGPSGSTVGRYYGDASSQGGATPLPTDRTLVYGTPYSSNTPWTITTAGSTVTLVANGRSYTRTVPTYTLNVSNSPSDGGSTNLNGTSSLVEGASVSLTATANYGRTFSGWTATGISLVDPSNPDLSFQMPGNNVTLVATWAFTATKESTTTFHMTSNRSDPANAAKYFVQVNGMLVGQGSFNSANDWVTTSGDINFTYNWGNGDTYTISDQDGIVLSTGTVTVYTLEGVTYISGAPPAVINIGNVQFQEPPEEPDPTPTPTPGPSPSPPPGAPTPTPPPRSSYAYTWGRTTNTNA